MLATCMLHLSRTFVFSNGQTSVSPAPMVIDIAVVVLSIILSVGCTIFYTCKKSDELMKAMQDRHVHVRSLHYATFLQMR